MYLQNKTQHASILNFPTNGKSKYKSNVNFFGDSVLPRIKKSGDVCPITFENDGTFSKP